MFKVLLVYEDYTHMNSIQSALQKTGFDTVGITSDYTLNDQLLTFNPDIIVASGRTGKVITETIGRKVKENTKWKGKTILIFQPMQKPNREDLLKIKMDLMLEAPVNAHQLVSVLARLTEQDEAPLIEKLNKSALFEYKNSNDESVPGSYVTGGEKELMDSVFVQESDSPEDAVAKLLGKSSNEKVKEEIEVVSSAVDKSFEIKNHKDFSATFQDPELERLIQDKDSVIDENQIVSSEDDLEDLNIVAVQSELVRAENSKVDRQKKYTQFMEANPLPTPLTSSLKRKETRRAQKEMSKDWNKSEVADQDELRRQFTQALFKKKD